MNRNELITETAVEYTDGSMLIRSPHPEIERVCPLDEWIKMQHRQGAKVYQRKISVFSDWEEIVR